jgi:acetyl esterase/lipase
MRLAKILAGFALSAVSFKAGALPMAELMHDPPPQVRVYKATKEGELQLFYFTPSDWKASDRRAAMVWIHGGAWVGGTTDGFMPHARYCAMRGAVGFNMTYRLAKPDGPTVADCIADCKSAIRYIRAHAPELGVDPNRIAVAGDSAGGHLAAALGTLDGFNDLADDFKISARPDAMILFNPIVDMMEGDWIRFAVGGKVLADKKMPFTPTEENLKLARALSPIFHVHSNQPPTLLMHGLADRVVPPEQARRFAAAMKQAGNRCDLVLLENQGHAFAVALWKSPEFEVVATLRTVDRFLVSLGWLSGEPTLEISEKPAWLPIGGGNLVPPKTSPVR